MTYKKDKTAELIDNIIFLFLTIGMFILTFILTLKQANNINTGIYHSDIYAYMQEVLGEDSGYPFPYPLFFLIVRFFTLFMPVTYAMAFVVSMLNALALIITKHYLSLYNDISFHDKNILAKRILVTLFTVGLFFASMIINPMRMSLTSGEHFYVGVFTGNPWHNQTYIATRPFAIVAFFTFTYILKNYEYRVNIKDFLVFSVSLLLTTLTKPSFTLVLVSAAGIYMLYRLILWRFATIVPTLLLGCTFIPTFIELLRQYGGVFVEREGTGERGIAFQFFDVWSEHCTNIPKAILLANLFGIVVLLIFIREFLDDIPYFFTILFFITSIIEAGVLAEKGARFHDFNFSWGYMHGIFFLMLMSGEKLLRATFREEAETYKILVGWVSFVLQVACGLFYFIRIFNGAMYY